MGSPRGQNRRWILVVLDVLIAVLASCVALFLWNVDSVEPVALSWMSDRLIWLAILPAGTLVMFAITGCYMMTAPSNERTTFYELLRALIGGLILYYTVYFFAPPGELPRLVVLFYVMVSFPLFAASRRGLFWLSDRRALQQDLIVVGDPDGAGELVDLVDEHTMVNINVVGVYPGRTEDQSGGEEPDDRGSETEDSLPLLDPDVDLLQCARQMEIAGIVLFEREGFSDDVLLQLVECYQKGMPIQSGLKLIEEYSGRLPISYAREHPQRMFPDRRRNGLVYRAFKRLIDVLGAAVGLLVFAPLLPFLAAGIKLTSRGPVFFRQQRTGQYGEPFELVKLRTMVEDAEEDTGAQWAQKDDPRVTAIGKYLRLTHLDEFPQFWNVLTGDMSLVGPRPERPEIEAELTDPNPFFKLRHSVKPGVTGWATIKNQYVDSLEKAERRLEYDLYYIEHQSIWLDLHILFETFWELVTFGGR